MQWCNVVYDENSRDSISKASSYQHCSGIYTVHSWLEMIIGGFRDTYLGRQVVSRTGCPRAGTGSAGSLGERCDLP